MSVPPLPKDAYKRYHIETKLTPDILPWPDRFLVEVNRIELAKFLLREIGQYRTDLNTILDRPCVYGVFSGPIGGFAPRPELCVGCLRCTVEYPDIVQIKPNPERARLGDSYFSLENINAISFEAERGQIPVRGAGYRGRFGGSGWDGMWTDMSEIVRPTRDGIHGREFISTVVDIGPILPFLEFDESGDPIVEVPPAISIPIPLILDAPPARLDSRAFERILLKTACATETMMYLPIQRILSEGLDDGCIIPMVDLESLALLDELTTVPQAIALDGWHPDMYVSIVERYPGAIHILRTEFPDPDELFSVYQAGLSVFHLLADYHGRDRKGRFVFDAIREAHLKFVEEGIRDQVTLIGSGGITAAEHMPKAIIAGLDLVALDTPLLMALQAEFLGECIHRDESLFGIPSNIPIEWGTQRLMNLIAAWRDQLLEILGAMGLREVRRLRGEMGRALFQIELEREAFAGIDGYDS